MLFFLLIFISFSFSYDRLCGLVVSVEDYKHRGPGHSLGFFWGSWVWNGVHSASW
jgi:hypothetical protein